MSKRERETERERERELVKERKRECVHAAVVRSYPSVLRVHLLDLLILMLLICFTSSVVWQMLS